MRRLVLVVEACLGARTRKNEFEGGLFLITFHTYLKGGRRLRQDLRTGGSFSHPAVELSSREREKACRGDGTPFSLYF
jgi:hypothetical protein